MLEPGDKLGSYEIVRRIGVDHASVDYLAQTGDTTVLVKRFEVRENDPFVQMCFDDAGLGTIVNHENIAQLYEIGFDGRYYYLAIEYVDGEYLYRLPVPLSIDAILTIGIGVAAALRYAHDLSLDGRALEIVHGDVSPATVLIGFDGAVKLIDFRWLRPMGRTDGTHGKLRYLSPEQCRGKRLDRRTDLFTLGITLYELSTGRFPFRGDDELQIMTSILEQELVPPSQLVPGYPSGLERIVVRALERDLAKRYGSAADLHHDLVVLAGELHIELAPTGLARLMASLFPRA